MTMRGRRFGAALEPIHPSQAVPTPMVARKMGRAQHDARPKAAATPPIVRRAAVLVEGGFMTGDVVETGIEKAFRTR